MQRHRIVGLRRCILGSDDARRVSAAHHFTISPPRIAAEEVWVMLGAVLKTSMVASVRIYLSFVYTKLGGHLSFTANN